MKKRILIFDNAVDRTTCCPADAWLRHVGKVSFDIVHLPSNESAPDLDRYTHILLTGSEASFRAPQPWFDTEASIVRNAVEERGLAVLGSGFGHQMLAWALSGPEYVRRARTPELGWVAINILRSDSLVSFLPNPWHTYASHIDEVIDPPSPWHILAGNATCTVQMMRYGDHPVWGVQPHPETSPDEAKAQMEAGIDQLPRYAQQIRQAKIEAPIRDDNVGAQLTAAFLKSKAQKR